MLVIFKFKGSSIRFIVGNFGSGMNNTTTSFVIDGVDFRIPDGLSTLYVGYKTYIM